MYDIVGEACDSPFYGSGEAARAELQELLNAWAAKHVDVSRYWEIVGKTRELKITADDLPPNPQAERR